MRRASLVIGLSSLVACIEPPPASVVPSSISGPASQAETRAAPAYVVDPQMPVDFCEQRTESWWTMADGTAASFAPR